MQFGIKLTTCLADNQFPKLYEDPLQNRRSSTVHLVPVSFPDVNMAGSEGNNSPLSRAEGMKEWSCVSASPYALMVFMLSVCSLYISTEQA